MAIQFVDLAAQQARLRPEIDARIGRVLAHGQYIMGPEIAELEQKLAAFCGARHCVTCSSGTDALALVLAARRVKPGDAILCPSMTFAATAEVVAWLGASSVFVDCDAETYCISPGELERGVDTARKANLKPVGIIPVDLFGQPADYRAILEEAARLGLWVLSDAAQSFGAALHGRRVGTFGLATATSFFPAKPLGCYGDGGAVTTDDDDLAHLMRSLRVHGQGSHKYDNVRIGMAARLDTMQAAVLLAKLTVFEDELKTRERIARRYSERLGDVCVVPTVRPGAQSAWAQYTIRVPAGARDWISGQLRTAGIPTNIYYPIPLHRQRAYEHYPRAGELAISDLVCREVLAIPMHPYLDEAAQTRIIEAVRGACCQSVVGSLSL